MTTVHPAPATAPGRPAPAARAAHPLAGESAAFRRREVWATAALAVVGLLGGVATGLAIQEVRPLGGGLADTLWAVSVLAAVVGTYGVLVLLLLVARIPVLERAIGQDRLVIAHKRIAPWATGLVVLHVVLVVVAYAGFAGRGVLAEFWSQLTTTPWILPATAGLVLMVAAAVSSWRRVRRRLRHETWWTVHLYAYLAIALAFAHQLTGPFLDGWARALWIALYMAVFGAILWFRVAVPLWRSWRHRLRVAAVVRETPNVVSVVLRGRDLHRLHVAPGQFFNWRFLTPGLVYESHPYSVSGLPRGDLLRITVKALGDSSAALANLEVGTRVLLEGPYGAVTPGLVRGPRAVLVAGGVGVAPVRALAEAFAGKVRTDIIYRASTPEDLALAEELRGLGAIPGVSVHLLPGSRHDLPLDVEHLSSLVGDLSDADVFACGPETLNHRVAESARSLGVRPERIHWEEFDL